MKWLAIIKLILELISQLPFDENSVMSDSQIETAVRQAVDKQGLSDIDWEAALPHIVALVKIVVAAFKAPQAGI